MSQFIARSQLVWSLLLLSFLPITPITFAHESASNANSNEPHPAKRGVDWNDIKGWRPVGHRWAAALDEHRNVIAIYDLSFPDFLNRIPLGFIGSKRLSMAEILSIVKNLESNLEATPVVEQAITEVQKLDEHFENVAFPENWFESIPWKSPHHLRRAPSSFTLADIDFTRATRRPFYKVLAEIDDTYNEVEESGFDKNFLNAFLFVQIAKNEYEIYWQTPVRQISRPRKIADLKNTKDSFRKALRTELFKQAVGKLTDLITVPVVNALLETALDRFFHFHKLVVRTHQNMFLEVLSSKQDSDSIFAPFDLTAEEQNRAIEALVFAQTSLETSWKWIWKEPLREWQKTVEKNIEYGKNSRAWLQDRNQLLSPLNFRFGWTHDSHAVQTLVMLSRKKPNKKSGPQIAIDYKNPNRIQAQRIALEATVTAAVFSLKFVPLVGGWVAKGFKRLVESPVDTTKIWEGRLTVVLEAKSLENKSHQFDLHVLDQQRVNPLMSSRAKMQETIQKRRALIGLP